VALSGVDAVAATLLEVISLGMTSCFVLLTATITGAVISSVTLKQELHDSVVNEQHECGASDCPWYNMTAVAERPTDYMVIPCCGNTIANVYSAIIMARLPSSTPTVNNYYYYSTQLILPSHRG